MKEQLNFIISQNKRTEQTKCQLNIIQVIKRRERLILIAEVTSLSIMLGGTCNIQEITNGHMILDEVADKLI